MPNPDPQQLTPREIVAELDRYIVGQADAKHAVAVAMRNRYRRERLPDAVRREVSPKNILMIGPTGVGKTEIARRLATLAGAPFIKVEATKYTEVGYVGRDVESMVRDLAEAAVRMVSDERRADVRESADAAAVERVVDILQPETAAAQAQAPNGFAASLGSIFGNAFPPQQPQTAATATRTLPDDEAQRVRASARADVLRGFYDVRQIEIDVEEQAQLPIGVLGGDGGMGGGDMSEMLGGLLPKKKVRKRVTVADARRIFAQQEADKLIDMDAASSSSMRSTRSPATKAPAAPTCRARASSVTSSRSSKAAPSRRSTARSRPITCCSLPPAHFTLPSRPTSSPSCRGASRCASS
jgi:ATP-dependent HslUV protease ATP-binding subunit HslU